MSKKSRKRNKKILAAIGIGLGAAAMAKNKRDKSIDSGIEAANADKGSDMLSKTVIPKKKPDSSMPDNLSKNTGKDNKIAPRNPKSIRVKTNTNKVYTDATGGESTSKVGNTKSVFKGEDGYLRQGENATPMTPGRFGTYAARNKKPAMLGLKSGGRANYKHGGSTGSSKSSGCEIRGTSPILLKGKR
jgi:hypothetical protein